MATGVLSDDTYGKNIEISPQNGSPVPTGDMNGDSNTRHRSDDERLLHHHPHLTRLHHHPLLHNIRPRIKRPIPICNPTHALYDLEKRGPGKERPEVSYHWTSRNNRKGRHALIVDQNALPSLPFKVPPPTSSVKEICRGIWRMFVCYPVWDVSYDVAQVFTWGSVVWVINAFFAFLPLVRPETEFKNEILIGGGVTAFVGASIFVFGSVLLMIEAVNENRSGCFGWALEHYHLSPTPSVCTHHHCNKRNLVGKGGHTIHEIPEDPESSSRETWTWWPSTATLRSHYFHEIGFIASLTQMIAASIFEIAGLTALPGIINNMSRPIEIIFYWTPQVVGGSGFIISGALFMIETQEKWWKPAPRTLGWWIGFFNMIGGFGFTLCPAFGYDEDSWAQYQASLSTFWGSWAFLIGSVIQWYESLQKYPVTVRNAPVEKP